MKKLIGNIMSVALEVIMWITLIACIIGGVIIAKQSGSSPVAGFVIGTLAGIFINILVWGVISLMIETRDYVKKIAAKPRHAPYSQGNGVENLNL